MNPADRESDMDSETSNDQVESSLISIRDLIEEVRGEAPWTLSIAQRPFEWSPLRVANLIDSVLRGFPIGSLLVVRVPGAYYDFELSRGLRTVQRGSAQSTTQILDGQQRCAAILATYSGEGMLDPKSGGRIWLWINILEENKRYREFDEERGQKFYFHWSANRESGVNGLSKLDRKREDLPPTSPENGWVPFHRLVSHAEMGGDDSKLLESASAAPLERATRTVFEEAKVAILDSLSLKRIPIHHLPDQSTAPEDLHQVFVRINTGGMALSPVDQFFAGVKKYWPDAEQHLRTVTGEESLFGRRAAITLLARCAANALDNSFDPYSLGIQDLARGQKGDRNLLIDRMSELTSEGEDHFQPAVYWVSRLVRACLFHGARSIPPASMAAAVAWAYRFSLHETLPKPDDKRWTRPIVQFLFWTTALGSRRYGRTRFDRNVFEWGWEVGEEGRPFPGWTKDFYEVCFKYAHVQERLPWNCRSDSLMDDKGDNHRILNLATSQKALFLPVYQELDHDSIDWDHLVANEYARGRFRKGHSINWNPYNWVHRVGNFSGIDSRANRVFQDKPPSWKLFSGEENQGQSYENPDFIRVDPGLTAEDRDRLFEIEKYLDAGKQTRGGKCLKEFVADRSLRIWNHVIRKVGRPPKRVD